MGIARCLAALRAWTDWAGRPQWSGQDHTDAPDRHARTADQRGNLLEWSGHAEAGQRLATGAGLPAPGVRDLSGVHRPEAPAVPGRAESTATCPSAPPRGRAAGAAPSYPGGAPPPAP